MMVKPFEGRGLPSRRGRSVRLVEVHSAITSSNSPGSRRPNGSAARERSRPKLKAVKKQAASRKFAEAAEASTTWSMSRRIACSRQQTSSTEDQKSGGCQRIRTRRWLPRSDRWRTRNSWPLFSEDAVRTSGIRTPSRLPAPGWRHALSSIRRRASNRSRWLRARSESSEGAGHRRPWRRRPAKGAG